MARAVRISRRTSEEFPPGIATSGPGSEGFRPNTAALTRSGRLFGLFVALLLGSYIVFIGLLAGTSAGAGPTFGQTVGFLSGMAALLLLLAFALTLGRTPRAIARGGPRLVVVEFLGTRRTFPIDGSLRPTVENRYPAGMLTPEPTEMVALASARGPVRHYLVGRDMLADLDG